MLVGGALAEAEKKVVDGVIYHIARSSPEKAKILWDDDGKPLRTFPAARAHLAKRNRKPAFLMNGGTFE